MSKEEYGSYCVEQFARLFESEYNGVWDAKAGAGRVTPPSTSSRSRAPAAT